MLIERRLLVTKKQYPDDLKFHNRYTQRQWDRTVGYGKVPDEYSIDKWVNENAIVFDPDNVNDTVDKIKTVMEDEFGIDHPPAKKKEK